MFSVQYTTYLLLEIQQELHAQAARMVLNVSIDIPLIQQLFNQLLSYNIYTDEMIEMIYPSHQYSYEEFHPFFKKALQSIHYPLPENEQQARDFIIQYHLRRIAEQNHDPMIEMTHMLNTLTGERGDDYVENTLLGVAEPLYDLYRSYCYDDNKKVGSELLSTYTREELEQFEPDLKAYWAQRDAYLINAAKKLLP